MRLMRMASRSWIVLLVWLAAGGDAAAATRPQESGADTRAAAESRDRVGRPARERFTLPNGLEVLIESVPAMPQVGLAITFDVGAIHLDPDPPFDTSAFIALSWLVTGDAPGSPRLHSDLRRRYGTTWCAETGRDYTLVAFAVPRPRFDAELAAIATRLAQATVDGPTLRKVTGADEGGADMLFASFMAYGDVDTSVPGFLTLRGKLSGLWPAAGLGAESRGEVTGGDLQLRERTRLENGVLAIRPPRGHLAIIGPLDVPEMTTMVRARFGALPGGVGRLPPHGRAAPSPRLAALSTRGFTAHGQPTLLLGARAPAPSDPLLPATLVFNGEGVLWPRLADRFIAVRYDFLHADTPPQDVDVESPDFPGVGDHWWGLPVDDPVVDHFGRFLRGSLEDPGAVTAKTPIDAPGDDAGLGARAIDATAKLLSVPPSVEETERLKDDLRRRLGYSRRDRRLDGWDAMHRAITYARQIELGVDPDAFRLAVDAVVPADRPRMVRALLGEPPYVVEVLK